MKQQKIVKYQQKILKNNKKIPIQIVVFALRKISLKKTFFNYFQIFYMVYSKRMGTFCSFTSKYIYFAYEVLYSILKLQIKYGEKMFEEIPKNCRYGYVRVSSKSQESNSSIESQTNELIHHGIPQKNIRLEIGSAADAIHNRPVFQKLIEEELQENDLLMVTKINRCSRNTLEFLKLQDNLFQRSITFVALDIPHSNDLATNKLIATSLSAIATFENDRRKERQREGIKAAKAAGKYIGRKTVINKKLIDEVKYLKEIKNLSITQIAKITGRARTTIYKILKEELNYIPYNRLVKQEKINETNETK